VHFLQPWNVQLLLWQQLKLVVHSMPVLVVFTLLAFLFNGVVFAMCVSPVMRWFVVASDVQQVDGRARALQAAAHAVTTLVHSALLRWLARPLLPKGWAAGSFQTAGHMEAQRVALQKLGTRLAALSTASFL
jgi:hypothetical protein